MTFPKQRQEGEYMRFVLFIFAFLSVLGCSSDSSNGSGGNGFVGAERVETKADGTVIFLRPTFKGYRMATGRTCGSDCDSPNSEIYCRWHNLYLINEESEYASEDAVYFTRQLSYKYPNPNPVQGPFIQNGGWAARKIWCVP